ncbi:MAG: two-component system, OmpR family, sensor histidine kinase KdpD [Actinomycetota bacterium]|nr:two-component system, OmpR family, sensor histidine kinase KdpD [Actinomycetota bacterium]
MNAQVPSPEPGSSSPSPPATGDAGRVWDEARRGRLKVYLGAAPGVGKTYAMLNEGHRRHERGTDVVVALVETHGRAKTQAQVCDLEMVPRREMEHRGAHFTELDVPAVLTRAPQVALVDELAHTNVPGSRNTKRHQDVEELLAAGIDVITTVNVQHLESLNDVVERITRVRQRETVPDAVVRAADQIELVDMPPQALRRRMAHGNVYPAEKVDASLAHYFRVGNLTALRELALLWLADRVDEGLQAYRAAHGIHDTWEARERVVVALPGGPEGEALVRRGARIAARTGARLLTVHITRSDGLARADTSVLAVQRQLVESLGGSYHQLLGDDVAGALLEFARGENATQVVVGASRHSLAYSLLNGSTTHDVIRLSGPIDVHVVTHEHASPRRTLPRPAGALSRQRRLLALAVTAVGLPVLTLLLAGVGDMLNLASDLLIYLLFVLVVALVGGLAPALVAAVTAAVLVSAVVDLAARRASQAARASGESQLLATLAGTALQAEQALPALLDQVREAFGLQDVTLLERQGEDWQVAAAAGTVTCRAPHDGDDALPAGDDLLLAVAGRALTGPDRRILLAVAAQAATVREQQHLAEQAAAARPAVEADRVRAALLAAVSHDLRTPLATAKATVTALRSPGVALTDNDRDQLLHAADTALDRLTTLVTDLLDLSRLQAGALAIVRRRVALEELVPSVLDRIGVPPRAVTLAVPDDLPEVDVDPILLERALANVVANAQRYAPPGRPPHITGSLLDTTDPPPQVELRVIDHGPGIPAEDRERAFVPFQRLGDHDNTAGVGLGLAVARGLTEALGGTLEAEETPGGGLTMVLRLPAASGQPAPAPRPPHRALAPDPTQVPQVPPKASS